MQISENGAIFVTPLNYNANLELANGEYGLKVQGGFQGKSQRYLQAKLKWSPSLALVLQADTNYVEGQKPKLDLDATLTYRYQSLKDFEVNHKDIFNQKIGLIFTKNVLSVTKFELYVTKSEHFNKK